MAPRTILYTGKGGVGKTSVAAATARRIAAGGQRTLLISTDPAHSLTEALGSEPGAEPTQVAPCLWAEQVNAQHELERHWSAVRAWLSAVLIDRGVDRISAEELTVPPGMDEVFSLLRLQEAGQAERWDTIIVDCAPTGETIRLLSFPDMARWWLKKVLPVERQILATAGPLTRALLDIELPGHAVFEEVRALSERLIAMNALLRDRERCTIRLVMNPERMVIGEAMRTFTYLNLYGYLTDAVIVNRVFPEDVGVYFSAWREVQQEHLALVRSAFEPVPVLCAPYFEREVVGAEMLDRLSAAIFEEPGLDPGAILYSELTQEFELGEDGARLRLSVPFAEKDQIKLRQVGSELVVRVNGYKRTIALPSALGPLRPQTARFAEGSLEVSFQEAGDERGG